MLLVLFLFLNNPIYCFYYLCRFDVENESFFTASVRNSVVDYILERARFSDDEEAHFAFGVNRLVSDGVYSAAYPLHDVSF